MVGLNLLGMTIVGSHRQAVDDVRVSSEKNMLITGRFTSNTNAYDHLILYFLRADGKKESTDLSDFLAAGKFRLFLKIKKIELCNSRNSENST